MKNPATDKELGELHRKLATAMLDALDASDEARELLSECDEGDIPVPVWDFLEKCAGNNPALLTAIAKFLKDNDITCAREDSKELSALEKRLQEKKLHSVSTLPVASEAE